VRFVANSSACAAGKLNCIRPEPISPLRCFPHDPTAAPTLTGSPPIRRSSNRELLRELMVLAMPVWIEQSLHMAVGLNDT